MNNKLTVEEFRSKFEIIFDGPKTINNNTIKVMFNKFEILLRNKENDETTSTNIYVDDIANVEEVVLHKYCKL